MRYNDYIQTPEGKRETAAKAKIYRAKKKAERNVITQRTIIADNLPQRSELLTRRWGTQ